MSQIEFPITVRSIESDGKHPYSSTSYRGVGDFVSIRPCGDDKTYLGLMIGEIALCASASYNADAEKLTINSSMYNPAIFVFDLNRVVFGCESWWGAIKSEDDLRKITDADIQNIWYVKALDALAASEKGE